MQLYRSLDLKGKEKFLFYSVSRGYEIRKLYLLKQSAI